MFRGSPWCICLVVLCSALARDGADAAPPVSSAGRTATALTFPVVSDFTSGDEGWEVAVGLAKLWLPSGGDPGGFLRTVDNDAFSGGRLRAPAKFYGDWSSLDGVGAVSFAIALLDQDLFPVELRPTVSIYGATGHVSATADCIDSSGAWRVYRAPLVSVGWRFADGATWPQVLSAVSNVEIDMDFTRGQDVNGLDNVYVGTGPPPTWCTAPGPPDLVLGWPLRTVTPAIASPGLDVALLAWSVANAGLFSAGPFQVGFYLSPDSTITASDILLGSETIDGLGPGAVAEYADAIVTIPAATAPGDYYIGILADRLGEISETVESNNALSTRIRVALPDLVLAWPAAMVTPGIVSPGQSVALSTWSVTNTGPSWTGSFVVGFYLSSDPTITAADVQLGSKPFPGLSPGAVVQYHNASVTVPSGTVPGGYYIGILVDHLGEVPETNESNNALGTSISVAWPDLAIRPGWSLAEGYSSVAPGGSVSVSPIHLSNLSGVAASSFEWGVYLSADPVLTGEDVCLSINHTLGLPAWTTHGWQVPTLRIPPETAPGAYYLVGFVDCHDTVRESDEGNNKEWLAVAVSVAGPIPRGYVTNGPVFATVINPGSYPSTTDSILYIGGDFTQVGPATGSWVRIDAGTGQESHPYPDVAGGRVLAAASDSAGGWYIGGDFTSVAGFPRRHLAHILADGAVADWDPSPDSVVYALAYHSPLPTPIVVAGGRFSQIGGAPRSRLAALDAHTGSAIPEWSADVDGPVYALVLEGTSLLVGGDFTILRGEPRERLAWVAVTDGTPGPWISPGPDAAVRAVAVRQDGYPYEVTIGGDFHAVGGVARSHLAKLDGVLVAVLPWDPSPDGPVDALALAGTRVYVGGDFTTIAGSPCAHAAAVDSADGSWVAWDPQVDAPVRTIAPDLSAGLVYLGGDFASAGGTPRNHLAALDAATAVAAPWDPNANLPVSILAVAGSSVFAGGELTSIGGVRRNRLAAIDVHSGQLTSWDPDADGAVLCIYPIGDSVFVGGAFSQIGGESHGRLACLDRDTGAPQPWWIPQANDTVRAIYPDGEGVWIGGDFTTVMGAPWRYLATVDGLSGAPIWHPSPAPNGRVRSLLATDEMFWPADETIYVGGDFTRIAGQYRDRGAAFDLATRALLPWNPAADGPVHALTWYIGCIEGGVLLGGEFMHAGGAERHHIAIVDTAGAATSWNPDADGTVRALIWNPEHPSVILGGDFTHIGGQPRAHIAEVLHSPDGGPYGATLTEAGADGPVFALATTPTPFDPGSPVFAGGSFLTFDGMSRSHLGSFWFPDLTDVEDDEPDGSGVTVTLQPSFPNPTRGSMTIRFVLPTAGPATLRVYDLRGRLVRTLVDGRREAGTHAARWERDSDDGVRVGPGVYFYELRTPGERLTRKAVVLE